MLTQDQEEVLSELGEELVEGAKDHTEVEITSIPKCDYCMMHGKRIDAMYDGKTKKKGWAYMCQTHFKQNGVGLGLGLGQKLILKEGKMTKKDYMVISTAIKVTRKKHKEESNVLDDLVSMLSVIFKLDNTKFNIDKFEENCK